MPGGRGCKTYRPSLSVVADLVRPIAWLSSSTVAPERGAPCWSRTMPLSTASRLWLPAQGETQNATHTQSSAIVCRRLSGRPWDFRTNQTIGAEPGFGHSTSAQTAQPPSLPRVPVNFSKTTAGSDPQKSPFPRGSTSHRPNLQVSAADGHQLLLGAHDQQRAGDGRRRHDGLVHRVFRQQLEAGARLDDEDVAVLA
jgi:hypothetical protein